MNLVLKSFTILSIGLIGSTLCSAQESGFGVTPIQKSACVSEANRAEIMEIIANAQAHRKLSPQSNADVFLEWPVKQGVNYDEWEAIGISNYVDLEATFPNNLKDYNCGQRTYDTNAGYNHKGTDIYSWPFAWKKMDNDQLEIVAAAPGKIITKRSANSDKSCVNNNNDWNAVYIEHDDGSIAWYGHLKKNSLTNKLVGDRVETGDFLGIMGSSGNSSGPHLHLELYDNTGKLIDPFFGSCNETTDRTWWADQPDYTIPGISNLYTHFAPPILGCYEDEKPNIEVNFSGGETVYFTTYFRDQLLNIASTHTLIKPNGESYTSWQTTPSQFYSGSYWYRSFSLPQSGDLGKWTFKVEYEGKSYEQYFYLTQGNGEISLSENSLNFDVTPVGSTAVKSFQISTIAGSGAYIESISYPDGFSGNWDGRVYDDAPKEIQVLFSPSSAGNYSGNLILNTKSSGTTTLALSGSSSANIEISMDLESTIDFGEVKLGEQVKISTSILNTGNADLLINNIVYPEGFSGEKQLSIVPQEQASLLVMFKPTQEKLYSGNLMFSSNITSGSSSIELVGNGIIILNSADNNTSLIYPNPSSSGSINIKTGFDLIHIYDPAGKLLISEKSARELDISQLKSGIYIAEVLKNGQLYRTKLVVDN